MKENGFVSIFLVVLLLAVVIFYFGYKSFTKMPLTGMQPLEQNTGTPSQTSEEKTLLFDHGDFSFKYPSYAVMYLEGTHEIFWNTHALPDSANNPTMVLRWSDKAFLVPSKEAGVDVYIETYPPKTQNFTVTTVGHEEVPFGEDNTTLYSLTCGVDCYYHVINFRSKNKYYQLIVDGAGGGIRLWVDKMLASFKFYKENETKTYTNTDGNYSLRYGTSDELYENVSFSVDGVRVQTPDIVTLSPGSSISFKKLETIMTVTEYIKQNPQCDTIYDEESATIDGEEAIYQSSACGVEGSSDIYIIHKGILYHFANTYFTYPAVKGFAFIN